MAKVKSSLKRVLIAVFMSSLLTAASHYHEDFENVAIGTLPKGWIVDATHPSKKLATWEVVKDNSAPSGNKVLALTKINTTYILFGGTFNLCYTKNVSFTDGSISVKFKARSGRIDQGGGIMWRVQDHDNYYVARFNPLEDNFRFYSVKKGVRRQIASADVKLSSGWHEMKIIQKGSRFEGYLDGKRVLEADDVSCKKSGGVGLWTKADAATSFDDFDVTVEKE
jgi:hypothetical protein